MGERPARDRAPRPPRMPQILAVIANPYASSCRVDSRPGPKRVNGRKRKGRPRYPAGGLGAGCYPMRPGDPLVTCPDRHSGLRGFVSPSGLTSSQYRSATALLAPKAPSMRPTVSVVSRRELAGHGHRHAHPCRHRGSRPLQTPVLLEAAPSMDQIAPDPSSRVSIRHSIPSPVKSSPSSAHQQVSGVSTERHAPVSALSPIMKLSIMPLIDFAPSVFQSWRSASHRQSKSAAVRAVKVAIGELRIDGQPCPQPGPS